MLTFDPNDHTYRWNDVRVPSVTQVLHETHLSPNYSGWGAAQHRGNAVHLACEYLDLHDLDWETLAPEWHGYVHGYELFLKETGWTSELIEYQGYHPLFRYAGTLDRRGWFPERPQQRDLVDIKTGAPEAWHGLQLSGYQFEDSWKKDRRWGLYLKEDGKYQLKEYKDAADRPIFLAAVTLCHYQRRHQR